MIKEFHPDLLPKIRELDIKARQQVLSRTLTGNWLSTFKGRGIEFSGYRQYAPHDDANMIDWKASLRAGKLLVKELTEEKNLNVIILLDVSNSMLYGSQEMLKAEYAAQLTSSIAFAALRSGDAVGLVTTTDRIKRFLKPNIGITQHHNIVNIISKPDTYGGEFALSKSLHQVMEAMTQRGLVVIISDFIGLSEDWDDYLRIANNKFEIVGIMVRDPRDRRLPKHGGEFVLEDPFTDKKIVIDTKTYYKAYADYVEKEEEDVHSAFKTVKTDLLVLETGDDYVKKLLSFFHRISKRAEM